MTNTKLALSKPIEKTLTTPDQPDEFVTNKGSVLKLRSALNGLYYIHIGTGGPNKPKICEGFYTSKVQAEKTMSQYLRDTDRGYAVYPEKTKKED